MTLNYNHKYQKKDKLYIGALNQWQQNAVTSMRLGIIDLHVSCKMAPLKCFSKEGLQNSYKLIYLRIFFSKPSDITQENGVNYSNLTDLYTPILHESYISIKLICEILILLWTVSLKPCPTPIKGYRLRGRGLFINVFFLIK